MTDRHDDDDGAGTGATRRELLRASVLLGGAAVVARAGAAQAQGGMGSGGHAGHHQHGAGGHPPPAAPTAPVRKGPRPTPAGWQDGGRVIVPNGRRLPWKVVGGVKVFHLVAELIEHEIIPGVVIEAWGYNGSTPGPLIEAEQGDRVRIYVTNRLPEETTVHWHGVILANGMDGVGGLTQKVIAPGQTFAYEFTFERAGTFMYHPHFDEMTQMAMGMNGLIVVHPRGSRGERVRDHAIMLHEWKLRAGTRRPDPLAMNDFNVLTMNGVAFPGTAPIVAAQGDRVRLRFGNLSPMDHHSIHLHGHVWEEVATDGGEVPRSARRPETTVLVPVGAARVVEFVADALGDWPMHCHMTHHAMNQMGHTSPVLLGADLREADRQLQAAVPGYMTMGHAGMGGMGAMGMPMPTNSAPMKGQDGPFGLIDMGGMFTIVKVRAKVEPGVDPGWYQHPAGTVAGPATAAALARDGIDPDAL
ncbi:MAG: copper oxidase [Kofleriaceae bacterium]|nr:copper oxidase [Kofleriaceae bacterium]